MTKKTRQDKLIPGGEVDEILREAIQSVEDQLSIEDAGWLTLGQTSSETVTSSGRVANVKLSRLYYTKDPLGRQSIRLWTDYTFGTGMTWSVADENKDSKAALEAFWGSKANQGVLSARGQRKSSDKLLVDGEIFFALFLGSDKEVKIRTINPLEIVEIITNPDDAEDVLFYKRQWTDTQGRDHTDIYRSTTNQKGEKANDSAGGSITHSDDALVYHLTYNTITSRGNPLLLPALDWIKQYRRFLASRVGIMLALSRFAWHTKVKGGQAAVNTIKAKTNEQEIAAGSQQIENMGSDTQPIRTDTNSSGAYQDGKMLKYQICAAVGIPEQYFGDISTGNLATAKTVELPMMKMFQSYQKVWADTYQDIDEIVMEHAGVTSDKWYVDRDFPPIAPADVAAAATAMVQILQVMPELALSPDVQQIALMTMGVNDPAEVIDSLSTESKKNPEAAAIRAVRSLKESLKKE